MNVERLQRGIVSMRSETRSDGMVLLGHTASESPVYFVNVFKLGKSRRRETHSVNPRLYPISLMQILTFSDERDAFV